LRREARVFGGLPATVFSASTLAAGVILAGPAPVSAGLRGDRAGTHQSGVPA